MTNNIIEWDKGEEETKHCSKCNRTLPVSMFGREGKGKNGYLRYECRECAKRNAKIIGEIRKTAPYPAEDHCCPICNRDKSQLSTYGKQKKECLGTRSLSRNTHLPWLVVS